MASDSLKQVGKYIRKTGQDADRSLKRAYPIQPRLERTRDVFDDVVPFEMDFNIENQDERVLLDLFFMLPPPIRGCNAGCIHTACEEFDFPSGGNHYVTVAHPYVSGSVSVFINDTKLESGQVNEYSNLSGEVFFQGTAGPDVVVICYVYKDCGDEIFPECPALNPTIPGSLLLFSDRFDKTPSTNTWGGVGNWYAADVNITSPNKVTSLSTPMLMPTAEGGAVLPGDAGHYVFGNIIASGTLSEQLLAVDFTQWVGTVSDGFTLNERGHAPVYTSMSINGLGVLSIFKSFSYRRTSIPETIFGGQVLQTFQIPFSMIGRFYIRFLQYEGYVAVKIWHIDEEEPVGGWFEHTNPLPSNLFSGDAYDLDYTDTDFWGGAITATSARILAIQHWGKDLATNTFGDWNNDGDNYAWTRRICHTRDYIGADPADTYFGLCDVETDTLTQGTTVSDLDIAEPRFESFGTWSQFLPTIGYPAGVTQTTVSFTTEVGKVAAINITGEVKWSVVGSTSTHPESIGIVIGGFNYGTSTPSTETEHIAMSVESQLIVTYNTWTEFSITIPVVFGDQFQWGVHFDQSNQELMAALGIHTGSVLLPRTASIATDFRALYITALPSPPNTARPFCPDDGPLSTRCQGLNDQATSGLVIDYACGNAVPDTTASTTSGQVWTVNRDFSGPRVEFNNSIKILFKANGITSDGSDGRCPYQDSSAFYADRSATNGKVTLSTTSPVNCGDTAISYQFIIHGTPPPTYYVSDGDTETPQLFLINQFATSNFATLTISNTGTTLSNSGLITGFIPRLVDIHPNILYNYYAELTSETFRFKIWRADESETGTWLMEGARTVTPASAYTLWTEYDGYVDDNISVEYFNITVNPIDAAVV